MRDASQWILAFWAPNLRSRLLAVSIAPTQQHFRSPVRGRGARARRRSPDLAETTDRQVSAKLVEYSRARRRRPDRVRPRARRRSPDLAETTHRQECLFPRTSAPPN